MLKNGNRYYAYSTEVLELGFLDSNSNFIAIFFENRVHKIKPERKYQKLTQYKTSIELLFIIRGF